MSTVSKDHRNSATEHPITTTMLSVSQVAKRLNCSLSTVYALVERRQLEHYRCPGIRVSEEQLLAYLERNKQGRVPEPPKRQPTPRPRLRHITLN